MQRQLSYDPFDIHEPDILPPGRHLPNAVLDLFDRRFSVMDGGAFPQSDTTNSIKCAGEWLTASMTGPGWTCTGNTCTRSDVLNAGASYPAIAVTLSVGANAGSPQVNSVSVSGSGGSAAASATDSTIVEAAGSAVRTVSVTPSSGLGVQPTFALVYADPLGATDLTTVWVWLTSNFNPALPSNSCLAYYNRATNQLFLFNDAGTAWLSPVALGAAGTLSNSSCSINAGMASAPASGMVLTLNLPVTFSPAFVGAKSIYMYAAGSVASSGWQTMGSWDVPPASALSVASAHSGSFTQGQTGAYTVTVSNAPGRLATSGTVTVTDTLPSGLTLVSVAGTGWSCTGNTCTRSDSLAGGASYPAIAVTVNVAANATSPQVNSVSVSGGGSAPANGSDSTTIAPAPDFTVSLSPVSATSGTVMIGGSATYP
jgi:uncharacterized repeat protein (TIGR01451 family)